MEGVLETAPRSGSSFPSQHLRRRNPRHPQCRNQGRNHANREKQEPCEEERERVPPTHSEEEVPDEIAGPKGEEQAQCGPGETQAQTKDRKY